MNLETSWLEKYLEEIVSKIITHRFDLHIGNVGATSTGWMRYFDSAYLGRSSSGDEEEFHATDKELSKTVKLEQVGFGGEA